MPFCIFSFSQYGCRRSLCTSCSAHITAMTPWRSQFFDIYHTLSLLFLGGLLSKGEVGQLLHLLLTHPQWERDGQEATVIIAMITFSIFLRLLLPFGYPSGGLLWELQILVKSSLNRFSQHHDPEWVSWQFPASHSPVQGDIGDGSLCIEVPLIRRWCWLPLLCLVDNHLDLCSFQGLSS